VPDPASPDAEQVPDGQTTVADFGAGHGIGEPVAAYTRPDGSGSQPSTLTLDSPMDRMKFMLFTYRDPNVQLDPEQRATVPAAVAAWCEEMDARGVRLEGHVLGPVAETTHTIRIREGELKVDDGPVSEQGLQIARFNILECADLDEAIEVASKNPGANFGVLELRPIEP
jgi:hypothetical protein